MSGRASPVWWDIPREEDVGGGGHAHRRAWGKASVSVRRQHTRWRVPGWPELALPTTSAARVRTVAMATSSVGWGAKPDMVVRREESGRDSDWPKYLGFSPR